jgi:hypothetical protein
VASIFDELTNQWLKNTFLLGIDLTLDDGSPYPDAIYEQSLQAGVAYLEHELGIVIERPKTITLERHDALDINRGSWWGFRLDQRPVLTLDDWSLQYGSFNPVNMPVSWLQPLSREHGQICLIPSADSLGSFLYSAGVPLLVGGFQQPYSYLPGYFAFDYTAGFDMRNGSDTIADGDTSVTVTLATPILETFRAAYATGNAALGAITFNRVSTTQFTVTSAVAAAGGNGAVAWSTTTLPKSILHCIGLKAALLPIDIAGDLIGGAGVANFSIGADGIHQSLGTTSSATNCLHPDTRVMLADGSSPTIESLVGAGSFEVVCVDEQGSPQVGTGHSARRTLEDDVLAVVLSTGDRVLCNASHPFRLLGGEYAPAGDLLPGQALTPCGELAFVTVDRVEETGERAWLYDLTVDEFECFGIEQGVIVHNSGYGARRQAFERELKALLPALRAKFKAMNFGVI